MKTKIISANWEKEYESKFGTLHLHRIIFENQGEKQTGFYSSKSKDQNKFVAGKEAEFEIENQRGPKGDYLKLKPFQSNKGYSNTGRAIQREQSKYSGFSMSYAKDLFIAGKIESFEQMFAEAQNMFDWMVEADKNILK